MRITPILAALVTFLLVGCADRHLPTGQYQTEYADSTAPQFGVATVTRKAFDPRTLLLEMDVERHTLQDEYRVPLIITNRGKELYWAQKEPLGNYKWVSTKTGLAVDVLVGTLDREVAYKNQHAEEGVVKVDISDVMANLTSNVPIMVTCFNCSPFGLDPQAPDGSPISGPPMNISFELRLSDPEFKEARRVALERAEAKRREEMAASARAEAERLEQAQIEETRRQEQLREEERIAREGDGSPDDLLCKKYGFVPATAYYADCRLKLDLVRKEHEMQQQRLRAEQQNFQYQQAKEEAERRQRRLDELGRGLAEIGKGWGQNSSHSYIGPGGRIVNCTTFGSVTQCF